MSSSGKEDPPVAKNVDIVQKPATEGGEPGRLSSIVRSVGPTLRKVTEWNLGDLVSVYAVVLLVMLIVFLPYVIEQMKKAARSAIGTMNQFVSSGAALLGSSLTSMSVAVAGASSACGTFVSAILDGGGRAAGNLGVHIAAFGSQCSVFVKSSASALTSIGGSAKTVLSEVVKVCSAKVRFWLTQ